MPNQQGRQRINGGAGKSVSTHGSGLGTGPVGKKDGYEQRRESSGGSSGGGGGPVRGPRAFGGKGSLLIIAVVVIGALIFGGGKLSGLFGSSNGGSGNTGSGAGSALFGMLGNSPLNGSYADGWSGSDNTGKLNTSVAQGARAKRTVLQGGGRDTVTIMVYMCGTDLESRSGMASKDLREMTAAGFGDNVNVLVYTGGCKQWKTGGISNSNNQIYKVESGQLRLLEKNRGSGAMTNPATLTDFIQYCVKNYPATRNELILWDHGGGTISGYGYDEKNAGSGSMTLPLIAKALKDSGTTFDFIGFDACLMATLETALALDPYADYLIASEETEPGIGWYYTDWLGKLSANTGMSTPELGKLIVDDFVSNCAKSCPGQKATLSVIDIAELSQTVGDDLKAFSDGTAKLISGSGYQTVSKARSDTKEFGTSNKLDQVDLVHLALNLNTAESKALAQTLLSAVKYNRTGSGIANAYGISAYFPYRTTGKVDTAVKQLDAIGFDSAYTDCVRKFASLEVTGQVAGGGSASPFGSLFGSLTGGQSSGGNVTDLVGSLLGGSSVGGFDLGSLLGSSGVFDRDITQDVCVSAIESGKIDNSLLIWTESDGDTVLRMTKEQWSRVRDIQLNVFLDDGRGYIDLGLDNVFNWNKNGDLIGAYDGYWVALNKQPVAYYFEDQTTLGGKTTITGRVPVLVNGNRAELILSFEGKNASVAGVRYIYTDGETQTVAKAMEALVVGDVIEPICDRYSYDGQFEDSFHLGDAIEYDGTPIEVSDVTLDPGDGKPIASYVLTDMFDMEHWTPAIP